MYKDFTLIFASYNTPQYTSVMLKSFVHIHGNGPFNIIICENSTTDETSKILDDNNIKYIKNPGGTHSQSVNILLSHCHTKFALLVDTDIVFKQKIDPLLEKIILNDGTLMGEMQRDRGGYKLYPRIAPWFCLINVDHIKAYKISFHDENRIIKTNSQYFYQTVPLNPHVNNTNPFYDVGATFFEDITKKKLKIINAKGINKYFNHYEGGSWRIASGHSGYVNLGKSVFQNFLLDTEFLNNISIKNVFTFMEN